MCLEVGRDRSTIGRSAGISIAPVDPGATDASAGSALSGDADTLAADLLAFRDAGFTRVEFAIQPQTVAALEALAPVVSLVKRS
jgi:hypothetical protein